MPPRTTALWLLLVALFGLAGASRVEASAPGCGQAQVEALLGAPPPPGPTAHLIAPATVVTPFYQWENNDGYCGEVSLLSFGLVSGQWIDQYNTRLLCGAFFGPESNGGGASLEQAGSPLRRVTNYNAQLLIEAPGTGVSGPYDFAHSALCGSNARLQTITYPYQTGFRTPNTGITGYRDYLSWVKTEVIAGHQVTVAVLIRSGGDNQYDHEVSVLGIGTNHAADDSTYYGDDVLYFEDHGAYTLLNNSGHWSFAGYPSVPHGAGSDTVGCTPYVFAYRFDALANTRAGANGPGAPGYSIIIPNTHAVVTGAGNETANGNGVVTIAGPHNYAFAVLGPTDPAHETVPVALRIVRTQTRVNGSWQPNPWDANSVPAAGNNYENPYIGDTDACNGGQCASNTRPAAMLVDLQATVSGLEAGRDYNLYEYDFPALTGASTGSGAALRVPTERFNAQAALATRITRIHATGGSWVSGLLSHSSDEIIVLRAVPAEAP